MRTKTNAAALVVCGMLAGSAQGEQTMDPDTSAHTTASTPMQEVRSSSGFIGLFALGLVGLGLLRATKNQPQPVSEASQVQ